MHFGVVWEVDHEGLVRKWFLRERSLTGGAELPRARLLGHRGERRAMHRAADVARDVTPVSRYIGQVQPPAGE